MNLWSSFAQIAAREGVNLFIFPGGRLNARPDSENLRNPVYSLVNQENLDGFISWSSSIRYTESAEEFESFHRRFDPLPFVTMSYKIPGHPCVEFDSYSGMKALVNHFIQVHGARNIAFLRGPGFHRSAVSRYQGCHDALAEAGLAPNPALVSDPFNWDSGEAAAAQLLEDRGLVPGRDFDTLIGSSDLMVLGAVNYLSGKGYHLLRDYRAGGFNNTVESKLLERSLSTVHMPYTELGSESFSILLGLLNKRPRKAGDVLLKTELIIRESCGCTGPPPALNIDEQAPEPREPVDYQTMFRTQERLAHQARYEKEKWSTALNSLKCELLGTRDRNSLIRSLARYLPLIGITTGALILWEDEKNSLCVGSFSPRGISALREQRFSSSLLVPPAIRGQYTRGVFLVQPLFIENQSLGCFIHNAAIYDGLVFEELRSAVSYALKGIALLEELVKARKIAEQAERAKTEFLKVLENELYDPFLGMMDKLEELEKKLGSGAAPLDRAELLGALGELKALAASREAEASNLIDLTLARLEELHLETALYDPGELLPGIGALPLLSGDTARLTQCFSIIREEYGRKISAKARREGLALRFQSGEQSPHGESHRLLLAERIVLLHGGEFALMENACEILLPWITLTGQKPVTGPIGREDHALVLSDVPGWEHLFDLSPVYDIEQAAAMPGKTAFILWDTAEAAPEEFIKVSALRRRPEFAQAPFLCYGKGLAGKTLAAALDEAIRSPRKKTILFIEDTEEPESAGERNSPWELGEEIHIPSLDLFHRTVTELTPSLIVVNSLSTKAAALIRRHPLTAAVPIVMLSRRISSSAEVLTLSQYSHLILCHRSVASAPEFADRLRALMAGEEVLPPHTGILVKKALLYFDQYASSPVSRWKLADAANVSEDYLTRIFHRELGLPLWEYLTRYRVCMAGELLTQTSASIQEIALRTGFQDQAYFSRVFKKIYGVPPGHLRKRSG